MSVYIFLTISRDPIVYGEKPRKISVETDRVREHFRGIASSPGHITFFRCCKLKTEHVDSEPMKIRAFGL